MCGFKHTHIMYTICDVYVIKAFEVLFMENI
jgi:hypothetical protein